MERQEWLHLLGIIISVVTRLCSNARNSKLLQERKTETICDESKSELEEQLSHLFNISLTTINELDSEWDNKARVITHNK